jgi:ribonuclease P protein component
MPVQNPERQTFPKKARIRKSREYGVFRRDNLDKTMIGCFRVVVRPNSLPLNRLGVTATKKVGSSVARNRFKRLAREFFRRNRDKWPQGFDLLFIALREKDPFRETLSEEDQKKIQSFLLKIGQRNRRSGGLATPDD